MFTRIAQAAKAMEVKSVQTGQGVSPEELL